MIDGVLVPDGADLADVPASACTQGRVETTALLLDTETARLLAYRAAQLGSGAYTRIVDVQDNVKIALLELWAGHLDEYRVRRRIGDRYEDVCVGELTYR